MFSGTLSIGFRSRVANKSNLQKVTVLDLLGPCLQLINVPASVDESAGQKVGLLGRKPESELASESDLKNALAYTTRPSDGAPLTIPPSNGVLIEPMTFRRRRKDGAWMVTGDADILVDILLLQMHEKV